jgi:8-oxo-dGTP pyrophosphatase MutT (NUDIX family)
MAISPYIRRLRELVGHQLLLLPSVAVLPRDDQGRVLLVQVSDTGQWAAIGGAIEPDESPQQAGVREAQEEAGVEVRLGTLLGVLGGPEFRITYPNGDQTPYVSTVFEAVVVGGSLGEAIRQAGGIAAESIDDVVERGATRPVGYGGDRVPVVVVVERRAESVDHELG